MIYFPIFVVGLLLIIFSDLHLLKQRVINTEKDVASIKTEVISIKDDTRFIKEEILRKK